MTGINGSIYRWRVGEVEITRVLEFEAALFEPAVIHPGASSELIAQHRAWLEPQGNTIEHGLSAEALGHLFRNQHGRR